MSKQKEDTPEMRVIKTAACPTLSGSNPKQLTYEIGALPDGSVHLRITGNTGNGSFSDEWVSLDAILKTVKKQADAVTSYTLDPLFTGRSVNTPAFLLAVLSREKLVRPSGSKKRAHELADVEAFLSRMDGLASAGKTDRKNVKKKVSKKAAVKKKASVRKNTPVKK